MKNLLTIFLLGLFLAIPVTVSARKTIYVRSANGFSCPLGAAFETRNEGCEL